MQSLLRLPAAALVLLAMVSGCDDPDIGGKDGNAAGSQPAASAALVGSGWRSTVRSRTSGWGFTASDGDPVDRIRAALDSDMLPPKESVRITALVNGFVAGAPAPVVGDPPFRATAIVTPTPWNGETVLLIVAVTAAPQAGMPRDLAAPSNRSPISIDFDARSVAAFRPLGDPMALPDKGGATSSAVVIYELSPLHDPKLPANAQYGTLRLNYRMADGTAPQSGEISQAISAADFVDDLSGAPDGLRFAAAVAGFGGLLAGDPAMHDISCSAIIDLAQGAALPDPDGARARIIGMMDRAEPLIDLPPSDTIQQPAEAQR